MEGSGYNRVVGSSPWGVVLAGGIVAIVFGAIVIANPFDSLRFVTVLVGIFLALVGVFGIVAALRGGTRAGIAGPIIALVAGLILIVLPGPSLKTVAVIAGIALLAFGVVTAIVAITNRRSGIPGSLLGGLVLALFGVVVIAWPGPTLSLLAALVGIAILVFGVALVAEALRLRSG